MVIETIVTGPLQENCFVVMDENSNEALVIDPGWDSDKILAIISKHGIGKVTVILTHGHFDHISSADEIRKGTGAEIYMSPLDKFLLDSVGGSTAMMCGMGNARPFTVDGSIEEGDTFKAGNIELTAIATPGHTPGGMSFYDGSGHLFAGDTLFRGSVGRVDFPGSNGNHLIESITKKLYKLPPETIVHCGHGPDTTIGYEMEHNPFTNNPGWLG